MQNNIAGSNEHIYKGLTLEFKQISKLKTSGANGDIYDIEILNDETKKNTCVAKFLKDEWKTNPIRSERFKREIDASRELSKTINGILPIYDYSELQKNSKETGWFIMPKAKNTEELFDSTTSIEQKIKILLDLATIIKCVHGNNKAHRDIKPDNLLLYNGKIHLSDFGLIFNPELQIISGDNEKIGPHHFMAPEMATHIFDSIKFNIDDYKQMDIYSFGKVVWSLFNNNFKTSWPLNECNEDCFKKFPTSNIETLHWEPIFQLLKTCTRKTPSDRKDMNYCIKTLTDFGAICANTEESAQILSFYHKEYCERHIIEDQQFETKSYSNIDKIVEMINFFILGPNQYLIHWEGRYYSAHNCSREGKYGLSFSTKDKNRTVTYCFFPTKLIIDNIDKVKGPNLLYSISTNSRMEGLHMVDNKFTEIDSNEMYLAMQVELEDQYYLINRSVTITIRPINMNTNLHNY